MSVTSHKFLGAQAALVKLGALEFRSPQEAAHHYAERKDFGTLTGLLGALGGGALGGRYGATKGPTGALLGSILGAAGGYQAAKIPTEFAYDVAHDVNQQARMRDRADVAQLNVASGFPSGVDPAYLDSMRYKNANAAIPFLFAPGAATASYVAARRHKDAPPSERRMHTGLSALAGGALGAGVGALTHEALLRIMNPGKLGLGAAMLATEVGAGVAAAYLDKLMPFVELHAALTGKAPNA